MTKIPPKIATFYNFKRTNKVKQKNTSLQVSKQHELKNGTFTMQVDHISKKMNTNNKKTPPKMATFCNFKQRKREKQKKHVATSF